MKKLMYSPPEITVVDFKVEECFASPRIDTVGARFSRMHENNYYNTGEDYSEYTASDGTFSAGDWI